MVRFLETYIDENILTSLREKVMRSCKMITKGKIIKYQILPINSLRKCMETSLENLCVDKGAHRVKLTFQSEQKVPAGPDCGSG